MGTQNVQGSSEAGWVQKETDCVLDMRSNEVSPTGEDPVGKFETVDNSAADVDCDKTQILDSGLRVQNGSPDNVITNTIESQSGDRTDLSSGQVQNSVENLDEVKTPLRELASGIQNDSPAGEEVTANAIESQSGNRADLSADCVQEFCSGDVSFGHIEVESVKKISGSLDHVETPILDPQLRVENGSPPSKEVTVDVIDGQAGSVKADFSSDHHQVSHCDCVSLGSSDVQTVQNSVGNLDQMRTPMLDSLLRVENGSPASKGFISNAIEIESRSRDWKDDLSTACVQKFESNDVFLNCIDIQTEPKCVGNLDQIKTPTLDSELWVENASPDREVVSNAIESEKEYLQGDELLEETKDAK